MAKLELDIIEVPSELELEPTERVFSALVASDLVPLPEGTINLTFVDDDAIQKLNLEYSGNDYATDVLSFSYIEDGNEPIEGVVGEMAISLETAARQAEAAQTTLAEEVALLALHGTLHIAGYDHQTEAERDQIQHLQQQVMAAAGYAYREFKWTD
jgi:probable rRNA maturation factor